MDVEELPHHFKTPAAQLSDEDLYLSTIRRDDQDRNHGGSWGKKYPKCFFCNKEYRFSKFSVECHMDSALSKKSDGRERVVTACALSNPTHIRQHKVRFNEVLGEIRLGLTSRKTTSQTRLACLHSVHF